MEYCTKCLMPDTRPGIKFVDGVCIACIHNEKQKETDWNKRWKELESLCEKYRGKNGNGWDCAIAVSGGKDSHFQTYIMKEKLKMNPVLLTVGNVDWTETGRKNLENLSNTFGCDIIELHPNRKTYKILAKKAFEDYGQPSWYLDTLLYVYPVKMAMNLGIKLLVYGEDINYFYGGIQNEEKPSAMHQIENGLAQQYDEKWVDGTEIIQRDIQSIIHPSMDECEKFGLDPIYLSYFVPWSSHHNYEVAKLWGFRHLGHEHTREGSIDNYDQIDSLSYMLNPYLKYVKYGHSVATDNASRWIRYGLKTREEMIPIVEESDKRLDQVIVDRFCEFTGITRREFFKILDKWYNPNLFEKDGDGVWHPKFKVGYG